MKQDPYFKYLAAIILSGVFLALVNLSASDAPQPPASVVKVSVPVTTTARS